MWAIYLFSEQLVLQDKVREKKRGSWCGELRPRHPTQHACMSTATGNSDQRSEQASAASASGAGVWTQPQGTLTQPCPSASSTLGDVPSSLLIRSMNIGRISKPILVFLLGSLVGLLEIIIVMNSHSKNLPSTSYVMRCPKDFISYCTYSSL